ncbi:MAG: hypothetical protein QOH52_1210 [Pseudonocardiales bacterium]|jgi:hypothetical protein|nr:hypothetical protein [Pseudonocardiales bacterium]
MFLIRSVRTARPASLAAGADSAAAIALNADLAEEDVRNAVRDLDHGFLPRPTAGATPKESS